MGIKCAITSCQFLLPSGYHKLLIFSFKIVLLLPYEHSYHKCQLKYLLNCSLLICIEKLPLYLQKKGTFIKLNVWFSCIAQQILGGSRGSGSGKSCKLKLGHDYSPCYLLHLCLFPSYLSRFSVSGGNLSLFESMKGWLVVIRTSPPCYL